jgi:hypothetical protein
MTETSEKFTIGCLSQRLSRLSTIGVHKAPSSLWPYPPPDSFSYSDEEEHSSSFLRIGSHNHVLGNEIRIVLFRLLRLAGSKEIPKLPFLNDSYSSKESDDKEKKNLLVNKEKSRNRVALLVSIRDCREQTIQDAAVLRQSVASVQISYSCLCHYE